jgi:hypothetical protein|tara:strand:+ start:228 stop:437 length:210 start_codon:yes stop_codon:yes gene_type:complete
VSKRNNTKEETKVIEENPSGKSVEELKEIANTLQTQLQHHQTMAVKAQGALEVIVQMLPKEELENNENK